MPRADSLEDSTVLRLSPCVFLPLESRICCALGPICVAGRLCVDISFVRPFTALVVTRTVESTQERCTLRARLDDKLDRGVCAREGCELVQQKVPGALAGRALFAVLNDHFAARQRERAEPAARLRLCRERAADDARARHVVVEAFVVIGDQFAGF